MGMLLRALLAVSEAPGPDTPISDADCQCALPLMGHCVGTLPCKSSGPGAAATGHPGQVTNVLPRPPRVIVDGQVSGHCPQCPPSLSWGERGLRGPGAQGHPQETQPASVPGCPGRRHG